jgi:hypothetical protein
MIPKTAPYGFYHLKSLEDPSIQECPTKNPYPNARSDKPCNIMLLTRLFFESPLSQAK